MTVEKLSMKSMELFSTIMKMHGCVRIAVVISELPRAYSNTLRVESMKLGDIYVKGVKKSLLPLPPYPSISPLRDTQIVRIV
jgi:hypothetical protein